MLRFTPAGTGLAVTLCCLAAISQPVAGEDDLGGKADSSPSAATILSRKVICKQAGRYIAWPTVTKTRSGELLAVFSGDRDAHLCPWGKTFLVRSTDGGKRWSEPRCIDDTPLDDRDAGILETQQGTLLLTWNVGSLFRVADKYPPRFRHFVTDEMIADWKQHYASIPEATRKRFIGTWMRRSEDAGKTWSEPVKMPAHTTHGPIRLSDGRLLDVGNRGHYGGESFDDGRSWKKIASVPRPKLPAVLDEPHIVEAAGGKLIILFRHEPPKKENFRIFQSDSTDGGKTWSVARPTSIWADNPPHAIRLNNDWLVVVYGIRQPPYGQRACISRDHGVTWDYEHEIVLCHGDNNDLGYPSSAEMDDGSILTVYYQAPVPGEKPALMATHWRLETVN